MSEEKKLGGIRRFGQSNQRLVFWKSNRHFKILSWVKGTNTHLSKTKTCGNIEEYKTRKWEWMSVLYIYIDVFAK